MKKTREARLEELEKKIEKLSPKQVEFLIYVIETDQLEEAYNLVMGMSKKES